jgi:hypothetical protein
MRSCFTYAGDELRIVEHPMRVIADNCNGGIVVADKHKVVLIPNKPRDVLKSRSVGNVCRTRRTVVAKPLEKQNDGIGVD